MHKTGTYAGATGDNRNIDIGIDLASKDNVYVIIKSSGTHGGVHRTEYGQGDLTMSFTNIADLADRIQGLTSTGFQVGDAPEVNDLTYTYRYIAFWTEP